MTGISLYIPCFNAAETLQACLESVLAQTRAADEVLVIDDGSSDSTAAIAESFPVRVVSHGANRGLGAGRNTAIHHAAHEWIASLDADCIVEPEWLATLARELDNDEGLAGVGGRLIESHQVTLADAWRTRHMPQHWGEREIHNPMFLFGNNNLFRRRALIEAGGYLEQLRTNFEDVAMSETLRGLGYTLLYQPSAIVRHLRRDTLRSVLRANWRWRFFGYRNDINLRGLVRGLYRERMVELLRFLRDDLREFDPVGAALSWVAVGYAIARDIAYLVRHRGESRIYDPKQLVGRPAAQ